MVYLLLKLWRSLLGLRRLILRSKCKCKCSVEQTLFQRSAVLLVLFLIPVTVVIHGYQMLNAQDEVVRALQQAHFIKGWALVGAALLITQVGVAIKRD